MSTPINPLAEPAWLQRLRRALVSVAPDPGQEGVTDPVNDVLTIHASDLREAIGAAAPGPGSVALIGSGAVEGSLTIDYQTLLRWVHLTPDQAAKFAHTILRQVSDMREVEMRRRLSAARHN